MSDAPKKSFQIKVLPKKEAAPEVPIVPAPPPPKERTIRKKTPSTKSKKTKKKEPPQWLFLALVGLIAVIAIVFFLPSPNKMKINSGSAMNSSPSKLNEYLQAGQRKSELSEMKVAEENRRADSNELPAFLPLEEGGGEKRPMGVELSQDPALDKVYQDLYGEPGANGEKSPEERISARLAERKWVHRFEKEEKKTFIRNFIAAAREAGYEVELNDDLIVTKVKPITSRPKISLEKVIDKLNTN